MLGDFSCARYRFVLRATTPLRLGNFVGATLRGGFGHVFKRSVCLWQPGDCRRCLLKNTCAYPYIFETAPPPGSEKLRGLDQVPRPYVLEPPEQNRHTVKAGDRFEFRLVLIGRAIECLPYFVFTFGALGEIGLGADRGKYRVAEVHHEGLTETRRIYSESDGLLRPAGDRLTVAAVVGQLALRRRVTVHFRTPTRIVSDGKPCMAPSFQDLVRALLRRLSSLCYFHCGGELEVDFPGLIVRAAAVSTVASRLRWHEQERFSGRQKQSIAMGGVVGDVTFELPDGEAGAAFGPLLAAGEWVHVGKGAVMGLGKYCLKGTRRETATEGVVHG